MFLKIWRFLTILLTALSMSLSVAHLFEMPQRMQFDAKLWTDVTVFGNVFHYFGTVGAVFEVGAILLALILIFLVRSRSKTVFYLTLGGTICLIAAFIGWLMFVAPVNAELAKWLTSPIPSDWADWRRQWEYAHSVDAVIKIVGFALLTISFIAETPDYLRARN